MDLHRAHEEALQHQDDVIRRALATPLALDPTEEIPVGSEIHDVVDRTLFIETQDGGKRRIDFMRTVHIPPSIILGEE